MKLDRIILENFGVYSRRTFQFDAAPLVLVYGPNESGKTTALNGLRAAMFGFPIRTPYLTGKSMAAEVHGSLADGSAFQFLRKKGRKDEVTGKLGTRRLDGDDLLTMFGNMDLDSYQQLFGFSLEELRVGEDSLKSAKLSEALAGGGMGGASLLQNLRDDLANSTTALYRSRGSSQIGTMLSEIRLQQDELKLLQVLPQAVEELRGKLRAALDRGEQAKEEYGRLHQSLSRLEKLRQGWPKRRELHRIEQQLSGIEVPDGVDATLIAQWSDYTQQQSMLAQSVQQEKQQLERDQLAIAALAHSNTTPDWDARIESLGHQASEIAKLRKQLMEAKRQLEESQTGCAQSLEKLGLKEATEPLLKLSISAPRRAELEEWVASAEGLSDELLGVNAKLESANDQLARFEEQPAVGDIPDDLSVLSDLVARIRVEEVAVEQLVESVREKCELPEFEIAGARLRSRLQDCETIDYSWPTPSSADVARFLRLFDEQTRNKDQIERDVQRLEVERTTAERELTELQRDSERSAWGELKSVSAERDQVVQNWLDDLSEPLIASTLSIDQQKLRLQQLRLLFQRSDGLVQQIADAAETIAKIAQSQKQLLSIEEQIAAGRNQLSLEATKADALQGQWREAWSHCPFDPLSPELMASWVMEFESWSRVAAELDIDRRKLITRRGALKQLRDELIDRWPTVVEVSSTWQRLQKQLDDWTLAARTVQSELARRTAVEAAHRELQQRHSVLVDKQIEITSAYTHWLKGNELPSSWPLAQVTLLVDGVERLKRELKSVARCEKQIKETASQISSFEEAVSMVACEMKLGDKVATNSPVALAQQWLLALQGARKDSAERAKLSAAIEHRTTRLAEMTTRLSEIENRISLLLTSVTDRHGVLDRVAFDGLMQRAQQAAQLQGERSELLTAIEMLAGRESPEEFLSALADVDESDLSLQVVETKRALAQYDATRRHSDQEVGAVTSQLEQLAKSEAAQRTQQQLHAHRGQLAELAEQWVVGRLAQELLVRCIDRFTHDNEPVLLQLTHQYLAKLTGSRYVAVEHTADGGFCVRNESGESIEPDKLSTGTREQLYLAIRMAFITHYTEHHEPLPVLMDDCFVNFDDARTRLALQTLLGWKDSVQTILLSCHGRVVQQLAELAPATPVICLDRGTTHFARDIVGELEFTR